MTARSSCVVEPHPIMQRARGEGRIATKADGARTRLDRLFQEGCAKIRLPRVFSGTGLEAVLINSSGGLTGGDRLSWTVDAGAGTATTVTTQACEKVYRSLGDAARVESRITVGAGAFLAWLPQETILFDNANLHRTLDIDLSPGASALIVEPILFGRLAMGETVRRASLRDRWSVRAEGRLIHAEHLAFGPEAGDQTGRASALGGASAMASLLFVHADAEEHVDRVRAIAGPEAGVSGWRVAGSSVGKILARFVAEDGYTLRKRLVPVIEMLNVRAGVPKVWSL